MKKVISVTLALFLCLSLAVTVSAAPTAYVVDEFDVLAPGELVELNKLAGDLYEETGVGIFFVFTYTEVLEDYPIAQLTGGMENYVVMLENETSWFTFYGGRGEQIDADEEQALRDTYDETETYVSGVAAFLKAAAAHFPAEETVPAVTAPTAVENVPVEEYLLLDEAGLLTEQEAKTLNEKLSEISHKHNAQINIATISSLSSGDVDTFVEYLYNNMEMGYGTNHDGVLLLICMDPREFRILSNGMAGDAISSDAIEKITDAITPDLSDGDYKAAMEEFIDRCDYYIDGHLNGFPFDLTGNLAIALIIGAVVGLIVAFVLKGQLKSVRMQRRAHDYVKAGSMQLTVNRDLYLYRTVNRVRKQTNNSSSGGSRSGSSRNVGGGSF